MGPVPDDHCDSMADDEGTGPTIESYAGRSRINAGKLGLQGVEGARLIASKVTRQTEQIDARLNQLGADGAVELFDCLTDLLYTDEGDEDEPVAAAGRSDGQWGLYSVLMGEDLIGDRGFAAGLRYACEDRSLRWLSMSYCGIKLDEDFDFDNAAQDLNLCDLEELTLSYNHISIPGLGKLLERLAPRNLRSLDLRGCVLEPEAVPHLAAFFSSPRCRSIETLDVCYNHLGHKGIFAFFDALMENNFTIQQIEVTYGNLEHMDRPDVSEEELAMPYHVRGRIYQPSGIRHYGIRFPVTTEMDEDIPEMQQADLLHIMPVTRRKFLERNRSLYTRVGLSAMQLLPIARIFIHARPPVSEAEVAELEAAAAVSRERLKTRKRKCECLKFRSIWEPTDKYVKCTNGISLYETLYNAPKTIPVKRVAVKGRKTIKGKKEITISKPKIVCRYCVANEQPHPDLEPFPLLKLPRDLQLRVARFSCDDETALSDAQWDRLVGYASHPDSLAQRGAEFKTFFHGIEVGSQVYKFMMGEFIREWRGRLGLAGWESNTANLRFMKEMRQE